MIRGNNVYPIVYPENAAMIAAGGPRPMQARSGEWSRVRAEHLAAHPACAACGGTTFLEVHHKRPYHLFPELELAESNLLTLCESPGRCCHLIWGHLFSWLSHNPRVVSDAGWFLGKVKRRP